MARLSAMMRGVVALLAAVAVAEVVTIYNDRPRVDVDGEIMDSHSQSIVRGPDGTFFLYGERYGNATGMDWNWAPNGPKVGVYTSPNLVDWTWQGLILNRNGTEWVPSVIYDESHGRFVAWFGAGCWGVATSLDGVHFDLVADPVHSRFPHDNTDGNALFIDDDGSGYIIFSDYNPKEPILNSHRVSIELLKPDLLNTTHINVTGFFPDSFVESPVLFKRGGVYYVAYGQCCCACRAGSGFVVFRAENISGPWTRQDDANCANGTTPFCKSDFTVPAQGFGISKIPTKSGIAYLWTANRWLQGPNNPPKCPNLCGRPQPADCVAPNYRVGHDPTYWAPLEFAADGSVLPFSVKDSFQLDLE